MRKALALLVVFAVVGYCSCTIGAQESSIRPDLSLTTEPQTEISVVRGVDGNVLFQCFNSQKVVMTNATWSKDSELFTDSPPRVVIGNGSVFFTPALPEDDGLYQCDNSTPLQFVGAYVDLTMAIVYNNYYYAMLHTLI